MNPAQPAPRIPQLPLRVALVNDHPLVLEGLRAMLRPYPGHIQVVERDSLVPVAEPVDIALLDTYGQSRPIGEHIAKYLAQPNVGKVALYVWDLDEQLVREALDAGADGVLTKRLEGRYLAQALMLVARGRKLVLGEPADSSDMTPAERTPDDPRDWPGRTVGLSMREAEMITLICQGLTNEQIGQRLFLSPNSVKSYIRTAYKKIGAANRSEAVIWGLAHDMRPKAHRESD